MRIGSDNTSVDQGRPAVVDLQTYRHFAYSDAVEARKPVNLKVLGSKAYVKYTALAAHLGRIFGKRCTGKPGAGRFPLRVPRTEPYKPHL